MFRLAPYSPQLDSLAWSCVFFQELKRLLAESGVPVLSPCETLELTMAHHAHTDASKWMRAAFEVRKHVTYMQSKQIGIYTERLHPHPTNGPINDRLWLRSMELFKDWTFIWSIYIPVWPKYLRLSSFSKQKIFCRSLKIYRSRENLYRCMILVTHTIHFCNKDLCHWHFFKDIFNLLVESWIYTSFPVTAKFSNICRRFSVCWVETIEDILAEQEC